MTTFSEEAMLKVAREVLLGNISHAQIVQLPRKLQVYAGIAVIVASKYMLGADNVLKCGLAKVLDLLLQVGAAEGDRTVEGGYLVVTAKNLGLYTPPKQGAAAGGQVLPPPAMLELIESCGDKCCAQAYVALALRKKVEREARALQPEKPDFEKTFDVDMRTAVHRLNSLYGENGLRKLHKAIGSYLGLP